MFTVIPEIADRWTVGQAYTFTVTESEEED
jgi:hypothetical protein